MGPSADGGNLVPPGLDSQTFKPVATHYNYYAISVHHHNSLALDISSLIIPEFNLFTNKDDLCEQFKVTNWFKARRVTGAKT